MKFILWPMTVNTGIYTDFTKTEFEIPDKNDLTKVILGLICVPEKAKILHPIAAKMYYKSKSWSVGIYLDYTYISSNPPFEELDKYVKKCICDRIDELKTVKTLRGIKDRSMLDDIKQLFVQQ